MGEQFAGFEIRQKLGNGSDMGGGDEGWKCDGILLSVQDLEDKEYGEARYFSG